MRSTKLTRRTVLATAAFGAAAASLPFVASPQPPPRARAAERQDGAGVAHQYRFALARPAAA